MTHLFRSLLLGLSVICFASHLQAQSISVMTINVAQYPSPFGWRDVFKRSVKLATKILHLETKPHVITIQEAWSKESQKGIKLLLKKSYPYTVMDPQNPKYGWGAHSGLMILSQHPIKASAYLSYSIVRGEDNFTRKGVLGIKITIEDQPFYIFTTHLQAGTHHILTEELDRNKPTAKIIRLIQAEEAFTFISNFIEIEDEDPSVIFTGDFNTQPELIESLLSKLPGFKTTLDLNESEAEGSVWNKQGGVKTSLVDHMFVSHNLSGISYISRLITHDITDHLTLFGTFSR